jgi:hypothetical protein
MYAGHFALIAVIQKHYRNTSPYTIAIGVCFLDIVFGILCYFGIEGFAPNSHAGGLGVDIHCDYSHSLVGSILLSLLYGQMTGSLVPGFLASFSHFIGDWMVHNQDLLLDPFTKIAVGGTNMWGNYPTFSFYFEMVFCIACGLYAFEDASSLLANGLILTLHVVNASFMHESLAKVLGLPDALRQSYTAAIVLSSFTVPALILGYILKSRQHVDKKKLK